MINLLKKSNKNIAVRRFFKSEAHAAAATTILKSKVC
jgi:hypothetical protein